MGIVIVMIVMVGMKGIALVVMVVEVGMMCVYSDGDWGDVITGEGVGESNMTKGEA